MQPPSQPFPSDTYPACPWSPLFPCKPTDRLTESNRSSSWQFHWNEMARAGLGYTFINSFNKSQYLGSSSYAAQTWGTEFPLSSFFLYRIKQLQSFFLYLKEINVTKQCQVVQGCSSRTHPASSRTFHHSTVNSEPSQDRSFFFCSSRCSMLETWAGIKPLMPVPSFTTCSKFICVEYRWLAPDLL